MSLRSSEAFRPSGSWPRRRGLRAEEWDRRERGGELNGGEDGKRVTEPYLEHLAEEQAPEPEAREEAEDVHAHRLSRARAAERSHDAGQKGLGHVVPEREQGHD